MGLDQLTERLNMLCGAYPREVGRVAALLSLRGEAAILLCLANADGPLLSGELTERCGLSTGRVANLLRQLEGKGLVARRQDDQDHRRVLVSLTKEGEDEAGQQLRDVGTVRHELLTHLGEEDACELLRLLERCLAFCGGETT